MCGVLSQEAAAAAQAAAEKAAADAAAAKAAAAFSPALRRARMIVKKGKRVMKWKFFDRRTLYDDADIGYLGRLIAAAPSIVKVELRVDTKVTAAGWAAFSEGIGACRTVQYINLSCALRASGLGPVWVAVV